MVINKPQVIKPLQPMSTERETKRCSGEQGSRSKHSTGHHWERKAS